MRLLVVALLPCPEEPNIDLHQILHFWFMFSAEGADSPKPRFRSVWIAYGKRHDVGEASDGALTALEPNR